MSDKMITVRDKQISEDTIVKALKAHCGFEEPKFKFQVDFFFAGERKDRSKENDFPYFISTRTDPEKPGNIVSPREMFSKNQIEEIIENLHKMIGD